MTDEHTPAPPAPPLPPPLPAGPLAPAPLGYAGSGMEQPYASAWPRAKVVIYLSWALIAVQVLMVWPFVESVKYYRSYSPDAEVDVDGGWFGLGLSTPDLVGAVLGLIYILIIAVATVFWFMWVHRTYRNLRPLGATGLTYSPGWAVGYYFIPILNLFRPVQVMRETWKASDTRYDGGSNWKALPAPALLTWWWVLHLTSAIVTQTTFRIEIRSEDAETLLVLAWVDLVMLAVDCVLLLVEIRIVRTLTDMQEARADARATAGWRDTL